MRALARPAGASAVAGTTGTRTARNVSAAGTVSRSHRLPVCESLLSAGNNPWLTSWAMPAASMLPPQITPGIAGLPACARAIGKCQASCTHVLASASSTTATRARLPTRRRRADEDMNEGADREVTQKTGPGKLTAALWALPFDVPSDGHQYRYGRSAGCAMGEVAVARDVPGHA